MQLATSPLLHDAALLRACSSGLKEVKLPVSCQKPCMCLGGHFGESVLYWNFEVGRALQPSSTASLFGQPAQQPAQPDSSSFSWLDAFQARQEALRAQAAGAPLLCCPALAGIRKTPTVIGKCKISAGL